MKRFHFVNNQELDSSIVSLCSSLDCRNLSKLLELIFDSDDEFYEFATGFCRRDTVFETVNVCRVDSYVLIPEAVYNTMKLCHKELDTFSIALIWRSILITIVECFIAGGFQEWQRYKRGVILGCETSEMEDVENDRELLSEVRNCHKINFTEMIGGKISFFNNSNEFLGYLRL